PPEIQPALAELEQLAKERPVLSEQITFLRELLPELYGEPIPQTPLPLTPEAVATKLAGGVPLFRGEAVPVDAKALGRRWQQVCAAVQNRPGGEPAKTLAEAVKRGRLDPAGLLAEVLTGRPQEVHTRADELGLDAGLAATVLRLAAFPALTTVSAALVPL